MIAFLDPAPRIGKLGRALANDVFVVFNNVELSPGLEATSLITPVIEKIASLSRQEFLDRCFNAGSPLQPVNDLVIDHNPQPRRGLVGDDEDDVGCGDMPVLR